MFNAIYLIPLAVFFSIVLCSLALIAIFRSRRERRRVMERMQNTTTAQTRSGGSSSSQKGSVAQGRGISGFFSNLLHPIGRKISPKDEHEVSELKRSFLKAGYRGDYLIPVYYGAKIICAVLSVLGYYLLNRMVIRSIDLKLTIAVSLLTALIGYSLPTFWLTLKTRYRREKIFLGLPDALDLMVVCVEAGMGLDATIHRVSEEIHFENKVISDEFRQVGRELRAGMMRANALRNLAMRSDQEDMSNLVALLIQTDRFGTSVAQALKVHSDSMRTKRFQRAEEEAAKIPVKLIFPLIFFIFPALFVVVAGPAAITIYRNLILR